MYAQRGQEEITRLALSKFTDYQLIDKIGPDITDYIFDRNTEKIVLNPVNADSKLQAVLFVNAEDGTAFLVTNKFAQAYDPTYSLKVSVPKNEPTNVLKFMSTGALDGFRIDTIKYAATITTAMITSATWQITDAAGNVLLTSI